MIIRNFIILGAIHSVETIAHGRGIRELKNLNTTYGRARWRKLKGIAHVQLPSGNTHLSELHWYEAHGVGKRGMKIKRFLD